jgi:hypothetical protein
LSNENPEDNEVDDKEEDVQKPYKVVPIVIYHFSKHNFISYHVHEHHDLKKHESCYDKANWDILGNFYSPILNLCLKRWELPLIRRTKNEHDPLKEVKTESQYQEERLKEIEKPHHVL